jgi:hypothetical protein
MLGGLMKGAPVQCRHAFNINVIKFFLMIHLQELLQGLQMAEYTETGMTRQSTNKLPLSLLRLLQDAKVFAHQHLPGQEPQKASAAA